MSTCYCDLHLRVELLSRDESPMDLWVTLAKLKEKLQGEKLDLPALAHHASVQGSN